MPLREFPAMDEAQARLRSPLQLAHLGDAVWSLLVRQRLIFQGRNVHNMHGFPQRRRKRLQVIVISNRMIVGTVIGLSNGILIFTDSSKHSAGVKGGPRIDQGRPVAG